MQGRRFTVSSAPPMIRYWQKFYTGLDGRWQPGLSWALLSPLFLGTIPILAKLAYATGTDVYTVVAIRTVFAAGLLWLGSLVSGRRYIRSSSPAILSSLIAGAINGIGSLFFYFSLSRIDASLGQLVNITYLVFVYALLRLFGQQISWLTLIRTGLAILAVYMLTRGGLEQPDWLGVGFMLVAALSYAVQLVLSQRILYDVPAPTVTLYALTAMAAVVLLAWFFFHPAVVVLSGSSWQLILLMGLATLLSRLTLFLGVKHLGSIQTALLGVLELVVTLALAGLMLSERLTAVQWIGAALIVMTVLLVKYERAAPRFIDWWAFLWRLNFRQRR